MKITSFLFHVQRLYSAFTVKPGGPDRDTENSINVVASDSNTLRKRSTTI